MANHGVGFHRLRGGTTNQSKQGVSNGNNRSNRANGVVGVPLPIPSASR